MSDELQLKNITWSIDTFASFASLYFYLKKDFIHNTFSVCDGVEGRLSALILSTARHRTTKKYIFWKYPFYSDELKHSNKESTSKTIICDPKRTLKSARPSTLEVLGDLQRRLPESERQNIPQKQENLVSTFSLVRVEFQGRCQIAIEAHFKPICKV